MDLYAENILDHYKHPHHSGQLADATITHDEKNLTCGDSVSLQLEIDGDVIKDLAWTGGGCAISQAGMSILSDELIGKSVAEAEALKSDDVRGMLGVPVGTRRMKCALLCLHTLKNALHAYKGEGQQSWHETVGNEEQTR
jgi:nitrogen fixation NifU-like protein